MLTQVISRNIFGYSFLEADELSRYSFIWMTLFASGLAISRGAHLGFDLLLIKLPEKVQMYVHIINHVLVGVFLVIFGIKGIDLILVAGMTPSPSMHIPMAYVYTIMPISAIVMLIFLIGSLIETLRNHGHHKIPSKEHSCNERI